MFISKCLPCIILFVLFTDVIFLVAGDDPLQDLILNDKEQNNPIALIDIHQEKSNCVDECFRRNQMASLGFEKIQEQCHQECDLEEILVLLQSSRKEEYARGVKALSELKDPLAVQPLIVALKRDIKERRGLWAWIIPALGALKDPAAVPVLLQTLTLDDDDWSGRAMSAHALGSIGSPSAVPLLLVSAWRADTRDAAIKALVAFRDKRSIPVFLSALDPDEDKLVREAAIDGLRLLGGVAIPQIIEEFTDFSLEHPDTEKRLWLCQLLGTSGDERALRILRENIGDSDRAVAKCAESFVRQEQ